MKKNNVVNNIIVLYGLSIAKLVFPLLTLPYLTRVLSVDTYGLVSYVKAVVQYIQIIIDFGFMLSGTRDIVRCAGNKEEQGKVISEITFARILLAFGAFLVLVIASFCIPILKGHQLYLILAALPCVFNIFLFEFYFRGIEKMEVVTEQFVIIKAISVLLTFVFVKGDADILLIPVLDIAGSLGAVIFIFFRIRKEEFRFTAVHFAAAFRRLRTSAVFFLSNMVSCVFNAFVTIIIGIACPESDIAYWSLCVQIIGAIQILYNPIADGIYPEMVKKYNGKIIKRTFMIFLPLVAAGCILSYFLADFGILIVAGSKYLPGAADLFRLLIPVLFISFPALILGWPVLGAMRKERLVTGTVAFAAFVQIILLIALWWSGRLELRMIAIVRIVTELALLLSRTVCFIKCRKEVRETI